MHKAEWSVNKGSNMFQTMHKFSNRLNGHVLHREYALEALRADLIGQEIACHRAYSPYLLNQQLKDDYKQCFHDIFVAVLANFMVGAYVAMAYNNVYVRSMGALVAVIALHLCVRMISNHPNKA
jgi:hypothetical protein